MFEYINENVKKLLAKQSDMEGVKNVIVNIEYNYYFQKYINKYFASYPKKNDEREDYNDFYSQIKNKSMIEVLSNNFNSFYDVCLKHIEDDKLHKWQVDDLEMIVAKFEITISKIITNQSTRSKGYICTKDEILEYMEIRDLMIEKVDTIIDKTIEYRRKMSD